MRHVTRDVNPENARDLLERVPRACICFASEHGPQALPVRFVWRAGHYLAGIPREANPRPGTDQEVVLLIDEGVYYFDLRALYMRGRVKPTETPTGAPASLMWLEVNPLKTVAWDYGSMREVRDAH